MSKRTGIKVQENRTDDDFIMLPTVDFCFKELMRNEKVRKGIIAALLGVRPEEIKETRLLPTILRKEYEDDKYGILDVRVEMHDGTQIDFEMQVAEFDFWKKRIVFYLSKMVTDQIHKGDDYDKIQKCIHVSILDFVHFPEDNRYYRKITFCDTKTGEIYTDIMEIHVLELGKLPPEDQNEEGIIRWMRFLNAKSRKELKEMAKYVSTDDVPEEYKEHEKEILIAQAKNDPKNANKPENIIEKMITGRLAKELKEICLLEQEYVKAENKETVAKYLEMVSKEVGTPVELKRFVRFETGEGLEKKNEDFAAEVAAQMNA